MTGRLLFIGMTAAIIILFWPKLSTWLPLLENREVTLQSKFGLRFSEKYISTPLEHCLQAQFSDCSMAAANAFNPFQNRTPASGIRMTDTAVSE